MAAHSLVSARMMWGGRCDGSCQLAGVSAAAVRFGGDLLPQWTIFVLTGSGEGLRQSCSSVSAAATVLQHSTIALTQRELHYLKRTPLPNENRELVFLS